MRALAASSCALVFLSLLFKPRAPTLYLFELLSKTLWSAEAPGAAGVGVCALAVLAGHPWSARTGRAWRIARSTSFGASRIARSTSFGAGIHHRLYIAEGPREPTLLRNPKVLDAEVHAERRQARVRELAERLEGPKHIDSAQLGASDELIRAR